MTPQPRDVRGRYASPGHRPPEPDPVDYRKNLEQFEDALHDLDAELRRLDLDGPIPVRAVGGFALLVHDLRDDGYTVDIDTITDTYPAPVRDAINRTAARLQLERDWINNMAAGESADETLAMLDAVFVPQDFGLERIELSVADVPTLTRAKAIAVDTDALSGRTRDWDDLLALLERQGIDDYDRFCGAYPEIDPFEHCETHRSLESWFRTGERGEAEPFEADFDFDDLDDL